MASVWKVFNIVKQNIQREMFQQSLIFLLNLSVITIFKARKFIIRLNTTQKSAEKYGYQIKYKICFIKTEKK